MLVIDLISDNPDNKFAPYQRMANAIIELTRKNGECSPENLLQLGFPKEEIDERWHMANAMANVELKLLDRKYLLKSRVLQNLLRTAAN